MTMLYNILVTKGLIGYQWIVRVDERKSRWIFPEKGAPCTVTRHVYDTVYYADYNRSQYDNVI